LQPREKQKSVRMMKRLRRGSRGELSPPMLGGLPARRSVRGKIRGCAVGTKSHQENAAITAVGEKKGRLVDRIFLTWGVRRKARRSGKKI